MDGNNRKFTSVMVIDDNQMDRYVAELMLLKTGLTEKISIYDDASKALHEIKKSASNMTDLPELILLDINMPHLNGFDFLTEYNQLPEHIKDLVFIYILTSSVHNEDRAVIGNYPFVRGIINKPLTVEELKTTLGVLLV